MFKFSSTNSLRSVIFAAALLSLLLFPLNHPAVQAGSAATVVIPGSNTIFTLDGVCSPSEYSDAVQVPITVGTNPAFPVYMKHTADDAYFCFGDASGIPLPNGGASSIAIYIDRNNDGVVSGSNTDDFGIWVPYDSTAPFAAYWGTGAYTGADPGGWAAAKHQILVGTPMWQVEFKVSRQTMGGWNHTVGLALFYQWWAGVSDDYSWPANGIWANPQAWGNASLSTGTVNIGLSPVIPTVDGQCSSEYADASTLTFNTSSGTVTAYLKHSLTDLYVCLKNLAVPAVGQENAAKAALYLNRDGTGGAAPTSSDMVFTITYNGTILSGTGDGSGYTGSAPSGNEVAVSKYAGAWDAEFRINSATIGTWISRKINLTVAEQNVSSSGNDYGWPAGYVSTIPNSWGVANLLSVGKQVYIPLLTR